MNVQQGYDRWAGQYDTNKNKTRDLEASSVKQALGGNSFNRILEIGCGTGKNSQWLQSITNDLTSIDLSEEMLAVARQKLQSDKVKFIQADILGEWDFINGRYDLVTFSLVLEHISDLHAVFSRAAAVLNDKGKIYAGELHPFKQYSGTRARFETAHGTEVLPCFTHHLSDFTSAAAQAGLVLESVNEHFDDADRSGLPRILAMIFSKQQQLNNI